MLIKQYLWAVGQTGVDWQPGTLLGDRYLVKHGRIVLDTQPALLPSFPQDPSAAIAPYLRLVPYQLHLPHPYGIAIDQRQRKEIVLLEHGPIHVEQQGQADNTLTLLPSVVEAWTQASALRQLNWLWQIAHLWQPCHMEKVATTLLQPELIRVEGGLVRLLELHLDDPRTELTLGDLGQLWLQWVPAARRSIATTAEQLCHQLIQGRIHSVEQLIAQLDELLLRTGHNQNRQVQIATLSDQGPTRSRNEDACYPSSGTTQSLTLQFEGKSSVEAAGPVVAIVCDGIGGHEGGDVASNLAIQAVEQSVIQFSRNAVPSPEQVMTELEQAICLANDLVSQRNDSEQRQERQRMGTTLVMGLMQNHELYIAHIGDSRAYWITRQGCHQLTLDDDVAAREVRLGYCFYRDALQHPSSGSLVQALGMNHSSLLHPTVQRLILDEDGVLLLCSDGLSDNDRVEQVWQTEILPLLQRTVDLPTVSQRLVEIGNTYNGYDNVTVGLMYCQVEASRHGESVEDSLETATLINNTTRLQGNTQLVTPTPKPTSQSRSLPWLFLGGLAVVTLGVGSLAYWLSGGKGWLFDSLEPPNVAVSPVPAPLPTVETPLASTLPMPQTWQVGTQFQVNQLFSSTAPETLEPIALLRQPIAAPTQPRSTPTEIAPTAIVGIVPAGAVLQVLSKQGQTTAQGSPGQSEQWLKLRVCSTPDAVNSPTAMTSAPSAQSSTESQPIPQPKISEPAVVRPGDRGWIQARTIATVALLNPMLQRTSIGVCGNPATSTSP